MSLPKVRWARDLPVLMISRRARTRCTCCSGTGFEDRDLGRSHLQPYSCSVLARSSRWRGYGRLPPIFRRPRMRSSRLKPVSIPAVDQQSQGAVLPPAIMTSTSLRCSGSLLYTGMMPFQWDSFNGYISNWIDGKREDEKSICKRHLDAPLLQVFPGHSTLPSSSWSLNERHSGRATPQ